jgi:hypothetical protein
MAIHFLCPLGHRLKVPDDRAGEMGHCPVCGQRLIVPMLSSAAGLAQAAPGLADSGGIEVDDADRPLDPAVPMPPPPPGSSMVAAIAAPPPLPVVVDSLIRPSFATDGLARTSGEDISARPSAKPLAKSVATRPAVRWATWAPSDNLEAFAVYHANPRQIEILYWTACLLPFAAVFCAAPALPHLQFIGAPIWAQATLCLLVLQLAYSTWLALLPDWSTVRVGQFLFGGSAVLDLLGMIAVSIAGEPWLSALGLAGARWTAVAWCGLAMVIGALSSAACWWVVSHLRQPSLKLTSGGSG